MSNLQVPGANHVEILGALLAIDRAVFADVTRVSPMGDALELLCQAVEGQAAGLICSILILDQSKTHLVHGAAPSLPENYVRATNGMSIGPRAGSCGTAAHRGQRVIVTDIANDPLWAEFRELALRNDLRACWSTPISSKSAIVLGTFAVYYHESRPPTERELQIVEWAIPLAAITIERKQTEETLREQREQLEIILDAAPAMICYKDKQNKILRANRPSAESLGLQKWEMEGRSAYDLIPAEAARYQQEDLEVIESGKPKLGIKESYRTASGEKRWVVTDKLPSRDREGNITGVIVFSRDVTEQHNAEMALRKSEERYRTLFEGHISGVYVSSQDGRLLDCNEAMVRILGYDSKAELLSVPIERYYENPADRVEFIKLLRKEKAAHNYETRQRRKDGSVLWCLENTSLIEDPEGGPALLLGTIYDVTDRKRGQEALSESEDRYRAIAETATDAVITMDESGKILFANNAVQRIFGYSPGELVGQPLGMLIPEPMRQVQGGSLARYKATGKPGMSWQGIEMPGMHRSGQEIPLEISYGVSHSNRHHTFTGIIRDVSERKRALEKVRESEARLRLALDSSGLSLWDCNVSTGKVYLSEGWSAMLGDEPKPIFTSIQELLRIAHPDDAARLLIVAMLTVKGEISSYREQHRVKNVHGEWMWIESTGKVIERDHHGRARRMIGTNVNISERKLALDKVRESEERLRMTLAASQMGFWEWDAATKRVTICANLHSIFGIAEGQFAGSVEGVFALVHPEDIGNVRGADKLWLTAKEPAYIQFRIVRPSGETRWLSATGSATLDASGKLVRFQGLAQDITGRHQLEEQLRRAQKMEAVGQLAGGVAHDFNNLLTVIRGHAEILPERAKQDASILRHAKAIQKAADRAATITRQLLAFGRKQLLLPRVFDLRAIVSDISEMLRSLIGSEIELSLAIADEALWVKADEGQIEQVVVNLVVNARDAMPHGGTLTVATSRIALGQGVVRQGVILPEGNYIRLAVGDTGTGIDAATQARMFEPFFTTKAAGKGTGLGLSTVYGIVKQTGGWIRVESELGKGATFEILLPEVLTSGTQHGEEPPLEPGARGVETVLVVDDEDAVREVICQFLETQGYTVLSAENGKRATELAGNQEVGIDLLVTDAVMPDIDGVMVAQLISKLRPGIKVLYISGYARDITILEGIFERGEAFLQKPFALDVLGRKIREVLS